MRRVVLLIVGMIALSLVITGIGVVRTAWWEAGAVFAAPEVLAWHSDLGAGEVDPLTRAHEELARSQAEVTLLQSRLAEYESIVNEGRVFPPAVVLARGRVLARERRSGRRFVHLDVGFSDGLNDGLAVVSGWSLAGRVAGIQRGRCLVQLVTDGESRIPALLFDGEVQVAEGLVVGTGMRGRLRMDYVEDRPGLTISPGMTVISGGMDWQVPMGLAIGVVHEARREAHSDHWHIDVRPFRPIDILPSYQILKSADAVTEAFETLPTPPRIPDSATVAQPGDTGTDVAGDTATADSPSGL